MAARQWMCRALWMVGLATVAAGCVDDGVSMHVICPAFPTIDDDGCTYDAAGTACVIEGVLNLSSAPVYRLNLQVESGLKPRARDVPPMSEPNGMQMSWAEVELRNLNGDVLGFSNNAQNPFQTVISGYVTPAGKIIVPLNVVGPEHVAALQNVNLAQLPQIIAAVTLHGTTNGDVDVASSEYAWPIRLIKVDPDRARGACSPTIGWCASVKGQDSFAEACTSNSAGQ